ncbi:MAG: dicarboxylate/amino acid:cation symporter [Bacteroides sp.]|nr:dicarboxylate/amino acid:cation symporter [Bacteroides sp.]MCM1413205.1 dicarboxylate/amino acid:cation symporter [Bacteroides sp.]MCM1472053.1 dicarboxylate/amino acid:cation symporter [Bacteroides sp.]
MNKKQIILWVVALCLGVGLGFLHVAAIDTAMNLIATIFTRLFRLLAVPTIILAIITTLASLGGKGKVGKMFGTTIKYTLLTTFAAAAVGLLLYVLLKPGNIPSPQLEAEVALADDAKTFSYADHFISIIPDNIVKPLLDGNVLALLLICFAVGIALSRMPENEAKKVLINGLTGLQDLLFTLIRWLIAVLPLGILAFSEQMIATLGGGVMLDSLGKYVVVILGGNMLQIFVVLPIFLLCKRINPIKAFRAMTPAVMMAIFTKSSAATLPVTMENAESRLGVDKKVSRFVLPICTTVNMNGCAAFIIVTSLYVMQNSGIELSWPIMLVWLFISVLSAVGNAGVPMGCYFLTLSLMAGIGADISIMGVILPIYTVIDMVETGENVWSDSCVCAMANRDISKETTPGRVNQ